MFIRLSLFQKILHINYNRLKKTKRQDADPKAIQINFTGNLTRGEGAWMYFIIEEAKETVLDSSKGIVKVLWFYFVLI